MRAPVRAKQTGVERTLATFNYCQAEDQRFRQLATGTSPAVTPAVVEERQRDAEAAEASWKESQVALEQAKAILDVFTSIVLAARVDVDFKRSRVAVTRADRECAHVLRRSTAWMAREDPRVGAGSGSAGKSNILSF